MYQFGIISSKLLLLKTIQIQIMSTEDFSVMKLEKHPTTDILDNHENGSLTVIAIFHVFMEMWCLL